MTFRYGHLRAFSALVPVALVAASAHAVSAQRDDGPNGPVRRQRTAPSAVYQITVPGPVRANSGARRRISVLREVADTSRNLIPRGTRRAIAFQPFEMVNPRTRQPMNPAAQLRLPNGRVTTVGQFYAQLNQVEQDLNSRGFSVRQGTRWFGQGRGRAIQYTSAGPSWANASALATRPITVAGAARPGDIRIANRTQAINRVNVSNTGTRVTGAGSGNLGGIASSPGSAATMATFISVPVGTPLAWIGDRAYGGGEFPIEWGYGGFGLVTYDSVPFIVEKQPGSGLNPRITYQVATQHFYQAGPQGNYIGEPTASNWKAPLGLVSTATVTPATWANHPSNLIFGVTNLPNRTSGGRYAGFRINFRQLEPNKPADAVRTYYVRFVLTDAQGNQVAPPSAEIQVDFGGSGYPPADFTIPSNWLSSSKPLDLDLPGGSIPFGIFAKGSGARANTRLQGHSVLHQVDQLGFYGQADARFGVRYFNFLSLVDESAPRDKTLDLLAVNVQARGGQDVPGQPGIHGSMNVLGQVTPIDVSSPGADGFYRYADGDAETQDYPLFDQTITIGPVPVHVTAGLSGSIGVNVTSAVSAADGTGNLVATPYVNTVFTASAIVDYVVAWGGLEAEINPLFGSTLTLGAASVGSAPQPVQAYYETTALKGKVLFVVGFYYPCPDAVVDALVGLVSGEPEIPLCTQEYNWPIFNMDGITDKHSLL